MGVQILGSPGNQVFVVLQESNEFLSLGNMEVTISNPRLPFPIFSNVYRHVNTGGGCEGEWLLLFALGS